jgi:uncharacterized protein (TIGR02145 family)
MKNIYQFGSWLVILLLITTLSCQKDKIPGISKIEITTKDVVLSINSSGNIALTGGSIISDGGMTIIARGVCWSTNQSPTILDKKTIDSTGVGSFSSRIGSMERFTIYYVRAYATTGLGTAYGNQVSFTSPCLLFPYIVPIDIYLISPLNEAIGQPINTTLKWFYDKGGHDGRFDVYFGTSPDPTTKIATNLSSVGMILSGLNTGTTYYWKIIGWEFSYPCNNTGSAIWHFSTVQEIKIPEVSTIVVIGYTYTSVTVGAYVTSKEGSEVTECGVYWGTSQNPESKGTKLQIGSGTGSFSTSLSGLNPNTIYYVKAYATNSVGTAYGSQVSFNTDQNTTIPTISDIEGNVYHIVTIGTQAWMAENLKTTRYSNGTSIPFVTDNNEWNNLTAPGYCWYNNDEATYKNTYGALYNWYTVNMGNLCPTGWHVPTDEEWTALTTYLGGESVAGGKLKETGTVHWQSPNTGATNESGFTAMPGGYRESSGKFYVAGFANYCWSATQYYATDAWFRAMHYVYSYTGRSYVNKKFGHTVRCLMD